MPHTVGVQPDLRRRERLSSAGRGRRTGVRTDAMPAAPGPALVALGRVWSRGLGAHTAALVLVVLALAPFMRLSGPAWVEQEGRLGLQVEALDEGGWEYHYAGEGFDPEHRWHPIDGSRATGVPAPADPALGAALTGVGRILDDGAGLYVLSMLGLVAAAMAAWLLAGEFEARASRPAFWLVVAGPPVVNAYVLWPHALSAGLAGLATVAALRVARGRLGVGNGAALALSLAAGAVLATEMAFFAGVVVVMLAGSLVWRRRRIEVLGVAVAVGGLVAAGVVAERVWMGRIVGRRVGFGDLWAVGNPRSVLEEVEARLAGGWRFFFDAGNVEASLERLVIAALVAAVAGGLFMRGRSQEGQFLGAASAMAAAVAVVILYGTRTAGAPVQPVLGLLAAWPVVLFALAAAPWRMVGGRERMVVAGVLAFALAIVVAQPGAGSEREWGGRLLSPVVASLAAVAAIALVRRLAGRPWQQQAAVVVGIVMLAVVPASRGLGAVREFRASAAQIDAELERVATGAVVIDNPRLVRTPIFSWRLSDDIDWFVSHGEAPALLSALAEAGIDEVTILPDPTRETLDIAPYSTAEPVESPILAARDIPVFVVRHPVGFPRSD